MSRQPGAAHTTVPFLAACALLAAACATVGTPPPEPPSEPSPAVAAGRPGVIAAEQVRDLRVTTAEDMLKGRFAGVEVIDLPGGGVSVRIRGATSVALGTEPLYVLDGTPIHAEPGGALKWLDPHEIARIEVLKDPASLAFYGSRGANGVILITMKH